MFGIGTQELVFIFLIIFFLFGAKKIPEIARGLGRGIREFKSGMKDIESDAAPPREEPPAKPPEADKKT
jgi:sec-independent protein translocase protein TatA